MTTATPDSIAIGTEPLRPSRRLGSSWHSSSGCSRRWPLGPAPVDGFNVTAVRTVRDRHGKVIHHDVYYSNYARITGIVLVGR